MSVERVLVEILDEHGETFDFDLQKTLTDVIQAAARHEEIEAGEVVISLVDDETIQELNRTYRQKDQPTDVLSFAMRESTGDEPDIFYETEEDAESDNMLGDIIISVPTAMRQAGEYGHSLQREMAFLAVHGFLHLLGYDHMTEEEEKEMFSRQETILESVGLTRG
jgi:probable rRNA maturation factor